jgi:hypothetical protein
MTSGADNGYRTYSQGQAQAGHCRLVLGYSSVASLALTEYSLVTFSNPWYRPITDYIDFGTFNDVA